MNTSSLSCSLITFGVLSLFPLLLGSRWVPQGEGRGYKCTLVASCKAMVNNSCSSAHGFCRRCTSSILQRQCQPGEYLICRTEDVPGGCGFFEEAGCDGVTCVNWVTLNEACVQFWCKDYF